MNTYNKEWYNKLKKSKLNPPSYLFGIVWPILYLLLAISFILIVSDKKCKGFCEPLILFTLQMILNISWTTVFFRLGLLKLALTMIIAIIIISIITAIKMYDINIYVRYCSVYIMVNFCLLFKYVYCIK